MWRVNEPNFIRVLTMESIFLVDMRPNEVGKTLIIYKQEVGILSESFMSQLDT